MGIPDIVFVLANQALKAFGRGQAFANFLALSGKVRNHIPLHCRATSDLFILGPHVRRKRQSSGTQARHRVHDPLLILHGDHDCIDLTCGCLTEVTHAYRNQKEAHGEGEEFRAEREVFHETKHGGLPL